MVEMGEAKALFEENTNLAHWVVARYFPSFIADDDAHQEALIGLWKACLHYDKEKSRFATFAAKCIANNVRMWLRLKAREKAVHTVSFDDPIPDAGTLTLSDVVPDANANTAFVNASFEAFVDGLNERDKLVIELRLQGLTQTEAAQVMGFSQTYYCRLLKQIKERYKKECVL